MSKMFQDCSFNAVSFKSEAKQVRQTSDGDSQTIACNVQDASVQSRECSSKMVQTEEVQPQTNIQYDEIRLSEFLKLKYSVLLKEFNNPSPQFDEIEDDDNDFSEKSNKLLVIESPIPASIGDVRVSASVWIKNTNLVCFGYSYAHKNWCSHLSKVLIYNLNMSNCSRAITPKVLETSCVTSLEYHPHLPNILAGAMFNGHIIIWDLNKEDAVIATSASTSTSHKRSGRGHEDAISQISWISNVDINQEQPMLATSGSDGFIMLWHFSPFSSELNMYARFMLNPPADIHRRTLMHDWFKTNVGMTCFSFSPHDPRVFIVGMDNGEILKCGITDVCIKKAQREPQLIDLCPVIGHYEDHNASVTDIKHIRRESRGAERFITSGVDKVIKIFEEKQDAPICIFHCEEVIMGLMFCNIEERVLLAWGCHKLYFFDICTRERLDSPVSSSELHTVRNTSVSSNGRCVIAVGNTDGKVSIWQISGIIKKE